MASRSPPHAPGCALAAFLEPQRAPRGCVHFIRALTVLPPAASCARSSATDITAHARPPMQLCTAQGHPCPTSVAGCRSSGGGGGKSSGGSSSGGKSSSSGKSSGSSSSGSKSCEYCMTPATCFKGPCTSAELAGCRCHLRGPDVSPAAEVHDDCVAGTGTTRGARSY
jgi:hypothetical protein